MNEFNDPRTLAKAMNVSENIGVSATRVGVYEKYDRDDRSVDVEAFAEALRFLRDRDRADSVTVNGFEITRDNEYSSPDDVTVVLPDGKERQTNITTMLDTIENAAEVYEPDVAVVRASQE